MSRYGLTDQKRTCSRSYPTKALDLSYNVQAQSEQQETEGVVVIVKPLHHKKELEEYFDADLMQYGILPLQLHIENKAHDQAVVVSADGIYLSNPSGEHIPHLSAEKAAKKAKRSYLRTAGWGVAFGLLGAVPSAINVAYINDKIEKDYKSRTLGEGDVLPGESVHGFSFFEIPEELSTLDGWKATVVMKDRADREQTIMERPLAGAVEPRPKPEPADFNED